MAPGHEEDEVALATRKGERQLLLHPFCTIGDGRLEHQRSDDVSMLSKGRKVARHVLADCSKHPHHCTIFVSAKDKALSFVVVASQKFYGPGIVAFQSGRVPFLSGFLPVLCLDHEQRPRFLQASRALHNQDMDMGFRVFR